MAPRKNRREKRPTPDRPILTLILLSIIIITLIGIVYVTSLPSGEKFTELYLLGEDGMAGNYPTNLTLNQSMNLSVGVVNHEGHSVDYQLLVKTNVTLKNESFTLKDGEQLLIPLNFTAGATGERKMEFLLYKLPDTENVYRSVFLRYEVD